MTDPRTLPAGTEVLVRAGAGELSYRTLRALRVRPIDVAPGSLELLKLGPAGWELRFTVSSSAPQIDPLDGLELHINPQGDLVAALRLYHALSRSLRAVSYAFEGQRGPERTTKRTTFSGGSEPDPLANPVERIRRFLHFPLAALSLRIPLDGAPAEWSSLRLRFALDPSWPAGLGVAPRAFLLHVAPMINLSRAPAEPIAFDGTRTRAEVAHPDPASGWRPREVVAVYRSTAEGLEPLPPSSLTREGEHYAVEASGRNLQRRLWLDLHLPAAVAQPTTVVAEAEWYQPAAARLFEGALQAAPAGRHIERVSWELVRPLQESLDSPLVERRDRLERLLEMSGRSEPGPADVSFLLKLLGAASNELFSRVVRAIAELRVEDGPDARNRSGQRKVYQLTVRRLPPALRPAADLLFARLPALLAVFYDHPSVTVVVTIEGDDQDERYEVSGEEVPRGQ